jgi:PadR family transcriptional regulator, regulatory protein AphA
MTTTTYAVLGLLAIRPWTTHELVQQVRYSLRRIWPRAESKLYEEPKKLVALGYATDAEDWVGRRPRTRYTITDAGRRALRAWVAIPGAGPSLEFEQLLKIDFADSGTKQDILANLAAALEWVRTENAENVAAGSAYLAGEGTFPQRAALNLLGGRFLTDFYAMVANWALWAGEIVQDWPDDPGSVVLDTDEQEAAVRLAEDVQRLVSRRRPWDHPPEPRSAGEAPLRRLTLTLRHARGGDQHTRGGRRARCRRRRAAGGGRGGRRRLLGAERGRVAPPAPSASCRPSSARP